MKDSDGQSHPLGDKLKWIVVADDLTGALDSGVEFANVGLHVIVATKPEALDGALAENPDILVINTASREGTARNAFDVHAQLRKRFDAFFPARMFKKVDSRLKGNIAAEISGLIGDTVGVEVLCASAIPDMGRICVNGMLTGQGIEHPIDVTSRLEGVNGKITIPDCRSDQDLIEAVKSSCGSTLMVGARGLAAAIARPLKAEGFQSTLSSTLKGHVFSFIGSRDPITVAQVDHLHASSKERYRHIEAANGDLCEPFEAIPSHALLQLTKGKTAEDARLVGDRFVKLAARFLAEKNHQTILACGGETAQGLLDLLNIQQLEIKGELFPGVPVSAAQLDGWPFSLITKSGGFGGPDLLTKLYAMTGEPV